MSHAPREEKTLPEPTQLYQITTVEQTIDDFEKAITGRFAPDGLNSEIETWIARLRVADARDRELAKHRINPEEDGLHWA
jgi:hypothetical protein